jgi:hypothetical protein
MHLIRDCRESPTSTTEAAAEPANPTSGMGMFVIPTWHRVYAQALIEVDPVKLAAFIEGAERAIMARAAALAIPPMSTDEILDLQHASETLLKLKADNAEYYPAKYRVA